jgi:hypothetical protein
MAAASSSLRDRLANWAQNRPDDHLLRWLFAIMVSATIAVIALDYRDLLQAPERSVRSSPGLMTETEKPSAEPLPSRRDGERRPGVLRTSDKALGAPISFELASDGRLIATGTIVPGAADAFAAEIEKRGGYVKTVVLHSPGGSVQDALKIGRLIRERKYNTEVQDARYCASSCPLVFAGGVERIAGTKAAIGVHQVSALTHTASATMADGMSSAQRVSAEVQRYLRDMGVDSQVWVHAMETPANELFYFKPDELLKLKLTTPRAS